MALLDGKQLRNQSTSLDKMSGTGIVTFTAATMSFSAGSVLRQADENILVGTDVVNKDYVDSVAQGLNIKESVHVVANSAITLSGTQSIDNHVVNVGERVLVNGQDGVNATASNGIYVVSAGAWTRSSDADGVGLFGDVQVGDFVFVGHGDLYQGTGWVLNTTDSSDLDILVGTESQHWTQFSSAGVITAGDGLGQTGVDIYVNAGIGLTISTDFVRIADTTVTAGNYGTAGSVAQFTVNGQGQLVGATSVSIDINSGQINDFDTAAQSSIFTTGNFVDGSTVDFTVTTGDSVTAEVTLGSLTASRLDIINPGSASQDWKLGYNASGQFEWFDPTQGDISEVVAGQGLSGGGVAGVVTLDVNVDNGLSIDTDNVILGGTLSQNTTINANGNNFSLTEAINIQMGVTGGGLLHLDNVNGDYNTYLDLYASPGNGLIMGSMLAGGTYSGINVNEQLLQLTAAGTTTQTYIQLNNADQTVGDGSNDNRIVISDFYGKGAVYNGDYTANFTTYSLVTKGYVDAAVSGVGATNGITELSPGVIGLGGPLGQNTTIDGVAYDLTIQDFDILTLTGSVVDVQLDNGLFLVDAGVGGSIDLYGGDLTIYATGSVDITSTNEFTVSTATGSISTSNLQGLVYVTDYSSTFVNNSLVSKQYVDDTLASNLILGVTAGQGISGGGTYGDISLAVELSGVSGLTFSGAGDAGTLEVSVDGSTIQINPSGQLTVVAGSSQPVYDEYNAANTTGDGAIVTGVTLSDTPNDYSRIEVYVNGQKQRLSGDGSKDCYFGASPIALSSLTSGDQLYWNGSIAGFDLSTSDIIEIVYEA